MKKKYTLRQRLQYAFDNTLLSGSSAIIAWLALISAILVIVFGIVYTVTGLRMPETESMGFFEAAWQALMRSVDPGTVAGDEGWGFRLVGLLITIGGIFILSTLIGVLTTGLEEKLDQLRKGRSLVLESGHTLILGWSDKIFQIVSQLIIANKSQPNSRIVILARRDKIVMEDELRDKIQDFQTTKVICRNGNPLNLDDIAIVNPDDAKSIIILSPDKDDPDTYVIKSVLALTNNPKRKSGPYHIVAEIDDDDNMEAARLVGKGEATYVRTSSMLARIAAQTCRQSGLSIVYAELLDYSGDEIYFKQEPSLAGKTYKELIFSYETSSLIGIVKAETDQTLVNPPMDTPFETNDYIIAIARDDSTIHLSVPDEFDIRSREMVPPEPSKDTPEKNVIMDWNAKGIKIIRELDKYVEPGSTITVIAESTILGPKLKALENELNNQMISFVNDTPTRRSVLNQIDFEGNQNVVILCQQNIPADEADAKTLISLLHLRELSSKYNTSFNIVSEMADNKNRQLAVVADADDFIIGDNLISLLLTQLSESEMLKGVFDCLFNAQGAEIYLNHAGEYIEAGVDINFYTLLEAASQRGETAIGYRLVSQSKDPKKNYGVRINPVKTDRFSLDEQDMVIVVANN